MYSIIVNGQSETCETNKKLMDFLREDLGLTGTKDGCNQGSCGACTVLVNGKASKACLFTLEKLAGKEVTTIEGLSQRQKDVYAYAFAKTGAVQCGYCIPGMVISAQGLLNKKPEPTKEDIQKAIRGNICRCTGYVKIIEAIQLAAKMFCEEASIPEEHSNGKLGEDFQRVDAVEKTLGTGIYVDDIDIEGMLHASALRSAYPRAKVLSIDSTQALAHPDCVAVFTAKDVPGNNKIGHLEFISDWDVMIPEGEITRYVGDAVALVVSKRKETLPEIKNLVEVDYEEMIPLTSCEAALAEGAPAIHEKGNILSHEHLVRGNAEEVLENSAFVVTEHYSVPINEHAFMEPECAIAQPEGEGILLFSAGQSIYDEQREVARMLGLDKEKIHVQSKLVGGGFGGKEDMSVQHHASLAAWLLKKPVKVLLSREESLMVHPKRHGMEMDFTTGCDEEGNLTAMKAVIYADTGAYASLGGPVLQRACTHAAGPYKYQTIDVEGFAVYTNNPPAGAFRGFGVCQTAFAIESNLNLLAEKVGLSPWEIRFKNAVAPGDTLPNGQLVSKNAALKEALLAVKDVYEQAEVAGISSFFKNSGVGVGLPDTGRCIISVEEGKIHVRTSAACIGQGMATVTTQIACETLNLPPEMIVAEAPDTRRTPNSGTTTASRQSLFTGEATRRAAMQLRYELDMGRALSDLEGEEFYGEYSAKTDPLINDKKSPVSHAGYGYAAEVAILDDKGKVAKFVAAYDMGQVVNPRAAEGQIEGGIAMGMGYALTEKFALEEGYVKAKYATLGLVNATQVPPIETILVHADNLHEGLAYGIKGVGELATIPTAPALAGAYFALDGQLRPSLPLENTPYQKKKDKRRQLMSLVSVIILASGNSQRMGQNKLFLKYQGKTFLEHTLTLVNQLDVLERILVVSPENQPAFPLPKNIQLILNHQWQEGQSSSIRLGTEQARGAGYLYLPSDQPLLTPKMLQPVLDKCQRNKIVVPLQKDGCPSSPVLFGNQFRQELLTLTGEKGGRMIYERFPEAVQMLRIATPGRLKDIDTPEEYRKLIQETNS
ncbi:selenium-dependent xanthine dehydrogenase [Enterococcus faecalis]|nr:selenium-dependent xanthine dehydrogenase [Enterococcus faecalis]NSQ21405.1 selenium-dependent xanthine dehydrogenase [Enterococcus faecalis]OSH43427.1 aldehyde oxidoreductase [Enterococcus faecalis]HAP4487370.1 selenium-dependent xanthine dehydrogenase [Enterococcus faecalis]HAP4490336.1 selenium-dependent xanthine dehydrogenase [Enterococcus faecalis]HAP4529438.1 selenium-dependent xanthine dehydrogenase [Enterococcus faecalis]